MELKDNEYITDALVVYRIQELDSTDERYRYSTSMGMAYGMGVGLADLARKMLEDFESFPEEDQEEGEG